MYVHKMMSREYFLAAIPVNREKKFLNKQIIEKGLIK